MRLINAHGRLTLRAVHYIMKLKVYGTPKAAKLIGVHFLTLHRWLREKRLKPPDGLKLPDGRTVYLWTDQDIQAAKKLKETIKTGRPPKGKA